MSKKWCDDLRMGPQSGKIAPFPPGAGPCSIALLHVAASSPPHVQASHRCLNPHAGTQAPLLTATPAAAPLPGPPSGENSKADLLSLTACAEAATF